MFRKKVGFLSLSDETMILTPSAFLWQNSMPQGKKTAIRQKKQKKTSHEKRVDNWRVLSQYIVYTEGKKGFLGMTGSGGQQAGCAKKREHLSK